MKKLTLYYFKKDLLQTTIICSFVFLIFFLLSKTNLMLDTFFGFEGYIGLGLLITCITFISTKVESFTKDFTTNKDFLLHVPVKMSALAASHMIVILTFIMLAGPFILYAALYTFKGDTITGFFSIFSLGWWGFFNMVNLTLMLSITVFVFILVRLALLKIDNNKKRVNLLLLVSHLTFFMLLFYGIGNLMPSLLSNPYIVFCVVALVFTALIFFFLKSLRMKSSR